MIINYKEVDIQREENTILYNVNFEVAESEFVYLTGVVGSGKSSLINLVSRLYDASKGEVLIGGNNVNTYDLETLRNNVSVVLQKNVLFTGTILDNLLKNTGLDMSRASLLTRKGKTK